MAPLLFLGSGCVVLARRPNETIRILVRHWWYLALPLFALSSAMWSTFPDLSVRYGVQLLATMAIALVFAYRMTPSQYVAALFVSSFLTMLASVVFGGFRLDGIAVGIFASKNAFATNIAIFALAAAATLLTKELSRFLKLTALLGLIMSPGLLLSARSSGAMITLMLAMTAFAATIIATRLGAKARRSYFTMVFAIMAIASFLAVAFGQLLLEATLSFFDKDVTLTGRTDLWAAGFDQIAENPLLGVGYQAFWVQGTEAAETLWAIFHIASRAGFHFHNTYISIGVELGLTGMALTAVSLFISLVWVGRWAMKQPSASSGFFLAFAVFIVARSFVEVDVFYQFGVSTITVIVGFVYAGQALAQMRMRAARPQGSTPLLKVSRPPVSYR